ncbi:MAG: FxLYD domain-containing protein [Nitrososphaeraceae archaeon]
MLTLCIFQFNYTPVYGSEDIKISSGSSFLDSDGKLNIIGVVTNYGVTSEQVVVGLDIHNKIDDSNITLNDTTFSKIIYPGKESPFKFKISTDYDVLGKPHIIQMKKVNDPFYNVMIQNYSNFPVGQNKELVGTLKNTGNVVMQNISVYASVHNKNGTQIDSIKSNSIPILKPGEVKSFSARPDNSIVKDANYFSCAGFDPNSPINTLDLGNGKFLAYGLESVAKISNFGYNKSTDSISFSADHYNPLGGIVTFKIPQLDNNHHVTIFLDNLGLKDQQITKNGKTIITNIFVPPNEHVIRIAGILNQ